MDLRAIRVELERLRGLPEVRNGFPDKASALDWANQVAPLLQFNQEYYANFAGPLHELHANISSYSIEPRWQLMLSQIDRAIADLKYREAGLSASTESVKLPTPGGTYVHPQRLEELSSLKPTNYDLTKLLALLRELNLCHQNRCHFAIATLVRAILDHVPPILNYRTFAEVANNYSGTRSFKDSMAHLETCARKIADQHLHIHIRRSEVVPTIVQVDFSNDLDVLLSEIVRLLKP